MTKYKLVQLDGDTFEIIDTDTQQSENITLFEISRGLNNLIKIYSEGDE